MAAVSEALKRVKICIKLKTLPKSQKFNQNNHFDLNKIYFTKNGSTKYIKLQTKQNCNIDGLKLLVLFKLGSTVPQIKVIFFQT